jgi:hypothetical protein
MGNPSFLDRAISTVRKAVEFDEAGNPQEAYKTYMNARRSARTWQPQPPN